MMPDAGSYPGDARSVPNRPKARTDAAPLITAQQRRRLLAASFADRQGFAEAQEYDAVRPRYPQQAVAEIMSLHPPGAELGRSSAQVLEPVAHRHQPGPMLHQPNPILDRSGPQVVDLGAGTGILTRQLLAAGARVHAVEPSSAMTEVLAHAAVCEARQLQISHTHAEHTGLASGSADIVVAAQAWHWFDAEAVQAEIARLLKPQAALALIWNYLDTADTTVHRLARIMRAGDSYRPGWQPRLDEVRFTRPRSTEYRWQRILSAGEIFRYATTLSSWLAADDAERARRRANLGDFLLGERGLTVDDPVEIPQITVLHTARLRAQTR